MDHASEYSRKLVSAGEAVRVVKSGDWVQYRHHANSPAYLDGFLAKRKDELRGVKVCAVVFPGLAQVATCDPSREHFVYNNWLSTDTCSSPRSSASAPASAFSPGVAGAT